MRYLALLVVLVAPLRAAADPKSEAKQHIDKATAAHQAGNYAEALGELNVAYTLDPKPELLYAIGQIHVKLGECAEAITFYERFLATHPKQQQADAANEAIAVCKQHPPEPVAKPVDPDAPPPPPPPKAPPPRVAQVTPPPPPQPPPPSETAFYRDKLGDVLVVGGVAAAVGGVLVYRAALHDLDLADASATYDQHASFVSNAQTKRLIALALGAGGAALATGGIFHYRAHARHDAVAIAPVTGGAIIAWSGSWP